MTKNFIILLLLIGYAIVALKPNALSAILTPLGLGLDVTKRPLYKSLSHKYAHHGTQLAGKDNENTIVFIGDSIIEYWDISPPNQRAINLGISNDSTKGVLARLDDNYITQIPNWYLAVGVNDPAYGYKIESIEGRLKAIANSLGGVKKLYWQVILPISNPSSRAKAYMKAYNNQVRQRCAAMPNCEVIEAPPKYEANLNTLTSDGLHPNTEGYQVLTAHFIASTKSE